MSKLHTTPVPLDLNTGRRRFGFPVPIFCGNTKQPNQVCDSWAEFYANERLLAILATIEERSDPDTGLREAVEKMAHQFVPRLLGGWSFSVYFQWRGEGYCAFCCSRGFVEWEC